VREIYDLMKWEPTSANSSPARFVWVRSTDGKATLFGLGAEPNKQKILQVPVTVIIGHDLNFAGKLTKLTPHAAEVTQQYFAAPGVAEGDGHAKRNAARRLPLEEAGRWV
jgi:3-hydroxypropanoate dehydrogenase